MAPQKEFDLHFSFPQRERKITVATSVCTGGRNSPPDWHAICQGMFPLLHRTKASPVYGAVGRRKATRRGCQSLSQLR